MLGRALPTEAIPTVEVVLLADAVPSSQHSAELLLACLSERPAHVESEKDMVNAEMQHQNKDYWVQRKVKSDNSYCLPVCDSNEGFGLSGTASAPSAKALQQPPTMGCLSLGVVIVWKSAA